MALIGEQSLVVKRMLTAITAQYCFNFILRQQIEQMVTCFNLEPTLIPSRLINWRQIEANKWPSEPCHKKVFG